MRAGIDATGAGIVRPGQRRNGAQVLEIVLGVADRRRVARLQVIGVVARAGHADLVEDAGLQELLVAHARDVLDHLLGDRVQDVVVGIALAEAPLQRDLAQPLHHFGVAVGRGRPEQQVTGAQAQATAVREQVADRHLPGHERV
ncbi:hypothetical protein G6F60_013719 [Rhizopus arrhizus]|nr:hypothetical protein G6F60_013719 [Rhizopus arrhizus]